MNVLYATIGALLSTCIPGLAVYLASKRTQQSPDVAEELSKLQEELDRARARAAKIQRKLEEERTMSVRAHYIFPSGASNGPEGPRPSGESTARLKSCAAGTGE